MTSRDFCYWLQGFLEINSADSMVKPMTVKQVKEVQKHLSLVFKHEIDPSFKDSEILTQLHKEQGDKLIRC